MDKRSVFAELMEGVRAMKEHREGKLMLTAPKLPTPEVKGGAGRARQERNLKV